MDPDQTQASGVRRSVADPQRPGRYLLEVTWRDGHVGRYPWAYVRAICPCANCRPTTSANLQNKQYETAADEPSVRIVNLQHVGHYALGITFEDAHQSIVPWEYLREKELR